MLNAITRHDATAPTATAVVREALEIAVITLSPVVPHVTHALWQALGHATAVIDERWPVADPSALVQDALELGVQVNGKLRGRITVAVDADEATTRAAALADETVKRFIGELTVRKVIVVRGKIVNVVVG